MYAGGLVLVAGLPLALGSWCDLAILVPFATMLVWRLVDEEALLLARLSGYADYRRKTPYRLIPYLW
jgi:protein-S-isoprenylcysteine O-methyltransferase Ste14